MPKRVIDVTIPSQHSIMDRSDIVDRFLADVRYVDSLTREEEAELIELIKQGDSDAKERLVKSYQKFIYATAKRFSRGREVMDLVSEGNIGLLKSLENFDASMGYRFISYAVHNIRRSIIVSITKDKLIRNTNDTKFGGKVYKIRNRFFAENGRDATNQEIAEIMADELDVEISDIESLTEVSYVSLNTTLSEDEDSMEFGDGREVNKRTASINQYENTIEEEYINSKISHYLSCLDDRSRYVVSHYFGIGCDEETLHAIGENMGICSERVRQMLHSATEKMMKIAETERKEKRAKRQNQT